MPNVAARSEPLYARGIDDYEAGSKLGHTPKVCDIESQQVRNCVGVAKATSRASWTYFPMMPRPTTRPFQAE
jgi:hypothetical protein